MSKQIEYGGTTLRKLLDATLASDCEFETRPTQSPSKAEYRKPDDGFAA